MSGAKSDAAEAVLLANIIPTDPDAHRPLAADTEAAIRRIWDDLAAADIPSQASAGRPHVTLAVAERIVPDVDELLLPVALELPLDCTVGA